MGKKVVATIESRMSSSRLPGKILMPLLDGSPLEFMAKRVLKSHRIDQLVIATTVNASDDPVVEMCVKNGFSYFRGSEDDVLYRVLCAAQSAGADIIVELTGDCPLIDSHTIDETVDFYLKNDFDYVYNRLNKGLPDGLDVQVFSLDKLKEVARRTKDPIDRVHVTPYFYQNPQLFKVGSNGGDSRHPCYWPGLEITLDEKEDFELIKRIFEHFAALGKGVDFTAVETLHFLKQNLSLLDLTKQVRRKKLHEG